MSEYSNAWLIQPCESILCAVAEHEIIHYFNSAPHYEIPFAPAHCATALYWQNRLIPLLNLSTVFGYSTASKHSVVLIYQEAPLQPLQYLALTLIQPPSKIIVNDKDACELPTQHFEWWQQCAKSCFTHSSYSMPVVVIDLAKLVLMLSSSKYQ